MVEDRARVARMKTLRSTDRTRLAVELCATAFLLSALPAAAAPRVLGSQDCEKCHKPAIAKWSKEEPGKLGAKAHFNTHKQLASPEAKKYAAAIGLGNPSDPKGSCVGCHATMVRGRVRSGVSCETCHGAASDYLEVHDKEPWRESYKKALPKGMHDLHEKTAAIAKTCVDCHVTPDQRLAAAGHPNGASFDAGASLQKIVHWTAAFTPNQQVHATYDFGQVSGAGKPLVAARLKGGGGGGARVVDTGGGGSSPAPAPVESVPWDWDAPVAELPADYPSEENQPPPPPPPPPSITEDLPLSYDSLPATESAAPEEPAGPPPPAAQLAELRGQAATVLEELLAKEVHAQRLEAPPKPGEFKGPDGELLHIQDVILYLAMETLRDRP